nr:endonuclease III [Candidatus Synchoanobacter obligatus]
MLEMLQEVYQGARIELNYETEFQLLIAVLLSAQATDIGVNKATKGLFSEVSDPQQMIDFGEKDLKNAIKSIGLYHTKAKNVMKLSHILQEEYQGLVPRTRVGLEALPGVGRKTANVVLNELFGHATIAVDTHIFRVCNRSGLAKGETPLKVELCLLKVVPEAYKKDLHQWLIQLGRYTCVARKPKCSQCPIAELCEFPDKVYEA